MRPVELAAGVDLFVHDAQFTAAEAAVADLHLVYATTARPRELQLPVLTPRVAMAAMLSEVQSGHRAGLLFGGER